MRRPSVATLRKVTARYGDPLCQSFRSTATQEKSWYRTIGSDLRMDYSAIRSTVRLTFHMGPLGLSRGDLLDCRARRYGFAEGFIKVRPFG